MCNKTLKLGGLESCSPISVSRILLPVWKNLDLSQQYRETLAYWKYGIEIEKFKCNNTKHLLTSVLYD